MIHQKAMSVSQRTAVNKATYLPPPPLLMLISGTSTLGHDEGEISHLSVNTGHGLTKPTCNPTKPHFCIACNKGCCFFFILPSDLFRSALFVYLQNTPPLILLTNVLNNVQTWVIQNPGTTHFTDDGGTLFFNCFQGERLCLLVYKALG